MKWYTQGAKSHKMAKTTERYPEEMHNIILKSMIEERRLQDALETHIQDKLD